MHAACCLTRPTRPPSRSAAIPWPRSRAGLACPADELAKYNGLKPTDTLREGETLALPSRVAAAPTAHRPAPPPPARSMSARSPPQPLTASAPPRPPPPNPAKPAGTEPVRHQVKRGETAFSIARIYNISARSIADWNGLGPDLEVREGQYPDHPDRQFRPARRKIRSRSPRSPVQARPRPSRPRRKSRCPLKNPPRPAKNPPPPLISAKTAPQPRRRALPCRSTAR